MYFQGIGPTFFYVMSVESGSCSKIAGVLSKDGVKEEWSKSFKSLDPNPAEILWKDLKWADNIRKPTNIPAEAVPHPERTEIRITDAAH